MWPPTPAQPPRPAPAYFPQPQAAPPRGARPESLVIPSKPPPTERITEEQPFRLIHKHPDDSREQVDIIQGSFSLHASHLKEHEALARKTAAAFSNALSIAEYVYNQPGIQGRPTPP